MHALCEFTTTELQDGTFHQRCRLCLHENTVATARYVRRCGVQLAGDESMGLGDAVAAGLECVGITKERVSHWLGVPCNCVERQEKLNKLGSWIKSLAVGDREATREAALAEIC